MVLLLFPKFTSTYFLQIRKKIGSIFLGNGRVISTSLLHTKLAVLWMLCCRFRILKINRSCLTENTLGSKISERIFDCGGKYMKRVFAVLLMVAMLICLCSCGVTNENKYTGTVSIRETRWEVGKTVTFGSYPQTKAGNDNTPIEWIVLARDGDKALIISKYALDCVQYNTKNTDITWETCSLRRWLNNDFYNKAFNTTDKQIIVSTKVTADKNPEYSTTYAGKDTMDKVFLLSIKEVDKYFKGNNNGKCAATDYALKKNSEHISEDYKVAGRPCCWWWLRSPGNSGSNAAYVYYDGSVSNFGRYVNTTYARVRPCMWVRA